MKIRIEVDESIRETEVTIKVKELNQEVYEIQNILSELFSKRRQIVFYKENIEYYISLDKVLFFETEDNSIYGHTVDDMYEVKYKLYELEEILPREFIRVSKSTILNVNRVTSINRNITSASVVEFRNSYKKTYVSRHYFKDLKIRIMEVRRYYEK